MYKISGESGDGLKTLGLKQLKNGTMELRAIETKIAGADIPNRKAGMGGARYVRHCLESAVLNRGGAWMPDAINQSKQLLAKIDAGVVSIEDYKIWHYSENDTGDGVVFDDETSWVLDQNALLEHRNYPTKIIHWKEFTAQTAKQASDELSRSELHTIWVDDAAKTLKLFIDGQAGAGEATTAFLAMQAAFEREFLVTTHRENKFDKNRFHHITSLRYVRTLYSLRLCEKSKWESEVIKPELTDLGRTILLLSACGWHNEASEIAQLAKPLILSSANQYIPLIPWFGCAWGAQNADVLKLGAVHKFDKQAYEDALWILEHWDGDDLAGLAEHLERMIDRRRVNIGQFDDEYHIDFDDNFSWTVPYEIGAILMARKIRNLPIPLMNHLLMELPTAQFQVAEFEPVTYIDDFEIMKSKLL